MNIGDIYGGLQIVTPPTSEPLSLADAENYLRVVSDGGNDDSLITALISAVRQHIEVVLRRALLTQTWKLSLKNWPGRDYQNWPQSLTSEIDRYYKYNYIKVPLPPLQTINSITYRTSDGTVNSMTAANFQVLNGYTYNVYTNIEPGRIVLPYAQIWPTDILMPGAPIEISFVCGFRNINDTSPPSGYPYLSGWEGYGATMQAMKLLLNDCWENRIPPSAIGSSSLIKIADAWLEPYRIYD